MRLLVIRRFETGPRCWVFGQRIHHGPTALLLAIILRKRRWLALAALALVLHDLHDLKIWFVREGLDKLDS